MCSQALRGQAGAADRAAGKHRCLDRVAGEPHQGEEGQADTLQQAWAGLQSLPERLCYKGGVPQATSLEHAPERGKGAEYELALRTAPLEVWRCAARHLQPACTGTVAGLLTSIALMDCPDDYTS